jgi:hypothetical protein
MTRNVWRAALPIALACAACGRGGDARSPAISQPSNQAPGPSESPTQPAPPGNDTPASPGTDTGGAGGNDAGPSSDAPPPLVGELRLLGVDQAAFTSARVKVKSVEAIASGAALDVSGLVDGIDLGVPSQAWLLGTFTVPASADAVEVKVVFEDAGAFDAGAAHGTIDSGCTAIVATLPVKLLALRGHAVVHLDVARSLVRLKDDAAMLVPQFEIAY